MLVTVEPALSVVITVRQGTVLVLEPDMMSTPVTVKTAPAESVVVISVVGRAEGAVVPEDDAVASGLADELAPIITPAWAQYCTPKSVASARRRTLMLASIAPKEGGRVTRLRL